MATATLPAPAPVNTSGDDTDHLYCCNPDVALCGLDISNHPFMKVDPRRLCPLCALAETEGPPCPVQGCQP